MMLSRMVWLLILLGCAAAWRNWRLGILAAVAVGLLQDPVRKLLPGAPAHLAMASFPIWASAAAGALRERREPIRRFLAGFPVLARWMRVFALYLVIPAVLSLTHGAGTWQITLLGGAVTLSTFALLFCGWAYPENRRGVVFVLAFYAVAASVLLLGGPLEQLGWAARSRMLGTEALGHVWVTHRTGRAVYMLAGFFRGPDIMGWHAATVCMVCMLLAHRGRGVVRWFWICLGIFAFVSLWLCGRRKMIAMLPVFFGCYLWLASPFHSVRRVLLLVGTSLLVTVSALYLVGRMYGEQQPVQEFYMSTLDEWGGQIQRHGWRSVLVTVDQAGFWGYGLGMSQQGVHNIKADKPRVWQESGPSKLFAEFGVPGTILFLVLGFVLLRTAQVVVSEQTEVGSALLHAGLLSIVMANLSSALVSAQIYGDTLIASLLAFWTGLLLSGGRFLQSGNEEERDETESASTADK